MLGSKGRFPLTAPTRRARLLAAFMALMPCPNQRVLLLVKAILLPAFLCNLLCPLAAWCQSNGGDQMEVRGFRAEIDVTVLDSFRAPHLRARGRETSPRWEPH